MKQSKRLTFCLLVFIAVAVLPIVISGQQTNPTPLSQSETTSRSPVVEDKDIRWLQNKSTVERSINEGGIHNYSIKLNAGDYFQVTVEQHGIDIQLALHGPDDVKVFGTNDVVARENIEQMAVVAKASGNYRLEVSSIDQIAPSLSYVIRIEELRPATERHKRRAQAEVLFREAYALRRDKPAEWRQKAAYKVEEAIVIFHEIDEPVREAWASYVVSSFYMALRDKQKTFDSLNRSLALWEKLGDKGQQAIIHTTLAGAHFNLTGDFRKALQFNLRAVELAHASGDRWKEAIALKDLGQTYLMLGERTKSMAPYEQAIVLFQEVNDGEGVGRSLLFLALQYALLGDRQKAIEYYSRAVTESHKVGDRWTESSALAGIGDVYKVLGEKQKAREYFERALPLSRNLDDPLAEVTALIGLGSLLQSLGEYEKSVEHFKQALAVLPEQGDRRTEFMILTNLAISYRSLGEAQKALDIFQQALEYLRITGHLQDQANTLSNIGSLYQQLNDLPKAIDSFKQALRLFRNIGAREGEALALGNLGGVYQSLNEYQRALDYYNQALSLVRVTVNPQMEAVLLQNLGSAYFDRKEQEKAFDYYLKALTIKEKVGDRSGMAFTLNSIGNVYYQLVGDKPKAAEYYDQSLQLARVVGNRFYEAVALSGLATVARDQGDLVEARSRIEAALVIIEALRSKLVSQELRASYFASMHQFYELYIDLLMRMHKQQPRKGFDAEALRVNERARARSLLETLNEARADIRQGVDAQLLERERSIQQKLNVQARLQMQGNRTEADEQAIAHEIEELTTALQAVQAQIRLTSPRYAALTQPSSLTAQEIQRSVVDRGTLFLEYSLGKDQSYLWVVSTNGLTSYALPGRAKIEAAARLVYDLLDARNRRVEGETPEQRRLRVEEADKQYTSAASVLSQIVIAPVAAQLGDKRLVIVADGALQFVPFGALPKPRVGDHRSSNLGQPLVVGHEIVSLPSASALYVLRREIANRKFATKSIAVLADPVYTASDERVSRKNRDTGDSVKPQQLTETRERTSKLPMDNEAQRAAGEAGITGNEMSIPRLPGTRLEAEGIAALVPASDRREALDFNASKETATSNELREYRFIHFAAHGFLNSIHPELSGILFSMVDENGNPKDGFLRAHEVYNLNLPVELVVLSACQTGLGKEVKGEGLIGLTRGFMYAGAPRVVVSLWSVSDAATAELMVHLYKGMLKRKLRPAAALRMAQVQMLKQQRWQSPFYWAAFTLQGEWR